MDGHNELEQSINDLRGEMGQEGAPSPSASLKPKEEPKTADDNKVDNQANHEVLE
ncbi:hypothetical protein RND71_028558 [Anisodus tanguticus]|uniref:Uncharacterized protein n=1 Tax=Anisodus tanguticus TaxID=243964 RepID=A0AAE1RK07_9SOLA|nr:hypothetical protein RND71_028558 [Anisodus tanguticus]